MHKGELDVVDIEIMAMIRLYTEFEGHPPSLTEIGDPIEKSKHTVDLHIRQMIRSGALARSGIPMKRTHGIRGLKLHVSQASPSA